MNRIERVEISRHRLNLDPPFPAAWDPAPRRDFPLTVVKVCDQEGRVGIGAGEPMAGLGDYLHLFLGQPVGELARHSRVLANISFHGPRPWPFDVALWDLDCQIREQPIWKALGGRSNKIRPYASWGVLRDAPTSVKAAAAAIDRGFRAVKLRLGREGGLDEDIEVISAVRQEVGPGVDLMVDCNQGWRMPWDVSPTWDFREAEKVLERLAPFDLAWVEEPLHRGEHSAMARLRKQSTIPIAGGEMTREIHEFYLMLEAGSLDVYQPDVVLTGGILELARLARSVDRAGLTFSPHTWGSGIALVANAHLTAGTVGSPYLEYPFDPPEWTPARRDFILTEPIEPRDGWIELGRAPGLGVALNQESLDRTTIESTVYRWR